MSGSPSLMDCTLREGGYEIAISPAEGLELARLMAAAGIRYIEIADNGVLRSSRLEVDDYVDAFARSVPQVRVGIMVYTGTSLDTIKRAVAAGATFVRVAANITDVTEALPLMETVKEMEVPMVTFNAMKTYTVPESHVGKAARDSLTAGADVFYIVDSAGCMLPNTIASLTRSLRDAGIPVGFHGHDNLSLAVANSLTALDLGAAMVDGTLRGVGRSAGNAQLEVLVKAAQQQGHFGDVDGDVLAEIAESSIADRRPRDRGISHLDLVIGENSFHTERLALVREVAEQHRVSLHRLIREVGRRDPIKPSRELIEDAARRLPHATSCSATGAAAGGSADA